MEALLWFELEPKVSSSVIMQKFTIIILLMNFNDSSICRFIFMPWGFRNLRKKNYNDYNLYGLIIYYNWFDLDPTCAGYSQKLKISSPVITKITKEVILIIL